MELSKRAREIEASATVAMSGKAKALKAEGKNVLSFAAGEPDFNSPASALEAACAAMERGETHYTANAGIPELRSAVCGYYKDRFGLDYKPSQVIISAGAKPLLYEALQALVDPGDEVILIAPAWVSYVEQIKMAGGAAVIADTENSGFIPERVSLESVITEKTKGLIINTPNNPTGAVYGKETLSTIAGIAREKGLWIIYDEIYERLTFGEAQHYNILNIAPDLADRTLLINGVSKAYAMTGWRIGYALGPSDLIAKMDEIQGHITSNASSIAQWAALGAIKGAEEDVERQRAEFERRRALVSGLIADISGISCVSPDGAFYVFINVKDTSLPDDVEFCNRLLSEKYVAAVPGSAFFAPGFVRFSYASSDEDIREGMRRLKEFVESL